MEIRTLTSQSHCRSRCIVVISRLTIRNNLDMLPERLTPKQVQSRQSFDISRLFVEVLRFLIMDSAFHSSPFEEHP